MINWWGQVIDVFFRPDRTKGEPVHDISLIKSIEAKFAPFQFRLMLLVVPICAITVPLYGTYFFVFWLPLFVLYIRQQTIYLQSLPDMVPRAQFKRVILVIIGNAILSSSPNFYCIWSPEPSLQYSGVLAISLMLIYALSARSDDLWLRNIFACSIFLQLINAPAAQFVHGMDPWRVVGLATVAALGAIIYVNGLQFIVETRTRLLRAAEAEFMDKNLTSLGQLTGGVAHDFNNLLTIILGNLDLRDALKDADPEASEELLDEVRDAAERAAHLTAQLLAFSRKSDLAPQRVELGQLIENSSALLQRLLPATHVLTLDLPPEPVEVRIDEKSFGTVLVNLVINARDAMVDGGDLVIRLHAIILTDEVEGLPAGDYARVEVRDTGIGMSPELLARALEPFYTTKPVGKGSGMGLSMAHGFAEQSGGKLTLQSDMGVGTVVRLWFPLMS